MSETHNPKQMIEQLQIVLSNPAKKIGFLFGAGISAFDKDLKKLIPNVEEMTKIVTGKFTSNPEKTAIQNIKDEILSEKKNFTIETLLSKLSEKERGVGTQELCGLNKESLKKLRETIESEIKELVSVHSKPDFKKRKINHDVFAQWIKNAQRDSSVEVFTTNYDYLLELAFEKYQIPYFDGFIGSHDAFFYPEWIQDDFPVRSWTKLWKLHGSLGWDLTENKEIFRTSKGDSKAMIYPSYLKYDHSRKQPYLSYMDRLAAFLRNEDVVLFVCGYSFGDEHINELIMTALTRSRSSNVFIFKNGELKQEDCLCKDIVEKNPKISIYAERSAVIGCKFGEWKLEREPTSNELVNIINHGFTEDPKGSKEWTGKGKFLLGDFEKFVDFLSLFYANSKYIKK